MLGIGFAGLLVAGLLGRCTAVPAVGLDEAQGGRRQRAGASPQLLFTEYLFPFELTSALLITAAVGAMVLAHIERRTGERIEPDASGCTSGSAPGACRPLPGPGVFATRQLGRHPGPAAGRRVAETVVTGLDRSGADQMPRPDRPRQLELPDAARGTADRAERGARR